MSDPAVLHAVSDLSEAWLSDALGTGSIASFETEEIGTGQMSDSFRVRIDYGDDADSGPASVVAKFASSDETSRATGVGLGAYDREVRFYRELAPRIGGPLPGCHAAVIDPEDGWFTLLLEDGAPAEQGDQITGCTPDQAQLAMHELARLHAPVFADSQLGATPWLNQEMPLNQALLTQLLPGFLERYADRIDPEHAEVCERFVGSLDGWYSDRRPPLGLVHGDYRLDNMLFGGSSAPHRFLVVDWQTVGWGPVMTDASYFLGSSLTTGDRREHGERLVREYYEALHEHGVRGFDWDECWTEYRRQAFLGLLMVIAPAMIVERTERGDEMFMVSLQRYAQHVLDLESLELLPEAGTGRPAPLRPEPAEESLHPAGPEELWNESWYFDAVSDDGSLGLYTRLGRYPNMGNAWMTTIVCGPGRPTVELVDLEAPLPDETLSVASDQLVAEHVIEEPLERFAVKVSGTGEAHDDAAAFLRHETGEPVPVEIDLVWETVGVPYAYRVTTRYEIPCRVRGTVRVGDEEIEFSGLGQRDHSRGTRDWWSAEWMWSAGHLDDGTMFHGVEFRIPDAPRIGVGYLQSPDGEVIELDSVEASEEAGDDGLITRAEVAYGEDLEVEVEPLAFGPLSLEAPDGRYTEFPRAMCRVTAQDGRAGYAWFEWNRNASLERRQAP